MYKAIVTELTNVRPHPNADRIKLATVKGEQVVVGLGAKDGDIGIYFPTDGQLSTEYAEANDLIGKYVEGKKVSGGFFSEKRRVRAQNFRGERSDGYWAEADTLVFTGSVPTEVGQEFDTWNGVPICNKYYTPKTLRSMRGGNKRKRRGETVMFKKHFDTKQFQYNMESIPENSIITITEKIHGTSGRYGYVLEELPKKWYHRAFNLTPRKEWQYLMGSRNVILEHSSTPGYYDSDEFRYNAVVKLNGNLRKGEVVYFELVGYAGDRPIMPTVKTKSLPDIARIYGDEMSYSYGCGVGECDLYVYRIAMINEDGVSIDLTWEQVKQRCSELGVKHVPELENVRGWPVSSYTKVMEQQNLGASTIDNRHIREGVCLRADYGALEPMVLKHKSYDFKVLEGIIKQDDDYVDMEEVS